MTPTRTTTRKAAGLIASLTPFETKGALAGRLEWYPASTGQLPADWREQLRKDIDGSDGSSYIVYSYATPIAWHTEAFGWTVPDAKYSVTTSRHQGQLYMIERD